MPPRIAIFVRGGVVQEVASRLQTARQPQPLPQARPRGRRPRGTR
jgi:hypothetical protein